MPNASTTTRPLNTKQQELLQLLYLFRFATATLIAQQQNTKNTRSILARLKVLVKQSYIGMNYDSSYKLLGKPASYYLLPKSFPVLKTKQYVNTKVLKSIYYDSKAKPETIGHYLHVFAAYNALKQEYGKYYTILIKSELRDTKHFPLEKPDLYLRRKAIGSDQVIDYFVYALESSTTYGRMRYLIQQYITYGERDIWQRHFKRELPTVLLVCEDENVKQKAQTITKRITETTFINTNFVFIDDLDHSFSF